MEPPTRTIPLSILELQQGLETKVEEILAELLRVESGTGKGCIEVNAFKESSDLDRHLCSVTNILPFPLLVLCLHHHRAVWTCEYI